MFKPLAAAVLALGLVGCAGAAIEGANVARDRVQVEQNIDKARAGDPVAEYKVGDALCCSMSGDQKVSFYNTREAVSWLCRSAVQGNGDAAYKLGRIYAGDTVDGVRVMRRVATRVIGTSSNDAVAYAWLRQAEARNVGGAQSRAASLWRDLDPADRAEAERLVQSPAAIPCEWDQVIDSAG